MIVVGIELHFHMVIPVQVSVAAGLQGYDSVRVAIVHAEAEIQLLFVG